MARVRAGFTLLELMLVMVILLVAAALAIPAIDTMLANGRVTAARDLVRARWADARGRAMQEGRPYKFSVIYQTGQFKVEPEDGDVPSDDGDKAYIVEGELPTDILFAQGSGSVGAGGGGGNYEPLAVYLPNGTARADVQVMFGKAGNRPIGLRLRALTGAVSMVDQSQDNQP